MTKRVYTAHHVLQALIGHQRNKDQIGSIEQIGDPYLYQALVTYRKDVEHTLDLLGLELVLHEAAGVAHARAMRPEQLEAKAESLGSYGIHPAVGIRRLNYYDTLAFLHFWRMMDATSPGTEPEWVGIASISQELSAHYGKSLEDHGATLAELVSNSLKRLETLNLIAVKTQGGMLKWRPRRAITLAVSHASVLQFEQDILDLLNNPNAPAPKSRRRHGMGTGTDGEHLDDTENTVSTQKDQQSVTTDDETLFALDIPFDDAEQNNADATQRKA